MTQRIQRHPFLALFDGPDTNTSTDTRTDSTVPLQALFLMNNPFIPRLPPRTTRTHPYVSLARFGISQKLSAHRSLSGGVAVLERFRQTGARRCPDDH
jgi:hypothetical protein